MHFNEHLRVLRETCGLTQEQVANVLEIDRSAYTYYEIGRTEPNMHSLVKLANLFKVTLDELLADDAPVAAAERKKAPGWQPEFPTHMYDLAKAEKQVLSYYRCLSLEKRKLAVNALSEILNEERAVRRREREAAKAASKENAES